MKISNAQLEEIDFLHKHFCKGLPITEEDKQGYIEQTVLGKHNSDGHGNSANHLINAKRNFDIMIKAWRGDLRDGLIGYGELKEDFNHPYFNKVLHGMMSGINYDTQREDGFSILSVENARQHYLDHPSEKLNEVTTKVYLKNKERYTKESECLSKQLLSI